METKDAKSRSPFQALVGYEHVGRHENGVVLELMVGEQHLGSRNRIHGGAVATLLDAAAGNAFFDLIEDVERTVTIELSVRYLDTISEGLITAVSRIDFAGKTIGHASVNLYKGPEGGKLMAIANGVFRLYRKSHAV
ncbi:PaaI family thioesterase [Rhodospirillaceae bacterium AH-315-P19]|nr:PaaI family thioesterase [Rhodospirillaceae bacterium AH-315-P19]